MKKLNKKEIIAIERLIRNEIKHTECRKSYESEMGNYRQEECCKKYIKTLENVYKKLIESL